MDFGKILTQIDQQFNRLYHFTHYYNPVIKFSEKIDNKYSAVYFERGNPLFKGIFCINLIFISLATCVACHSLPPIAIVSAGVATFLVIQAIFSAIFGFDQLKREENKRSGF